jgi:hypothetical protein
MMHVALLSDNIIIYSNPTYNSILFSKTYIIMFMKLQMVINSAHNGVHDAHITKFNDNYFQV